MQHNTMQRIFSRCHCRHHHHTECILLCYYATGCSFKISHFYHNILFQDEIIFNVFYALFFLFLSHYVCTLRAFSFLAICLCQVVKKHSEDCRNIQILESNIYNAFIIQQYSKVLKTFSACTSYTNVSHMYYSIHFLVSVLLSLHRTCNRPFAFLLTKVHHRIEEQRQLAPMCIKDHLLVYGMLTAHSCYLPYFLSFSFFFFYLSLFHAPFHLFNNVSDANALMKHFSLLTSSLLRLYGLKFFKCKCSIMCTTKYSPINHTTVFFSWNVTIEFSMEFESISSNNKKSNNILIFN